jgi:hypothetical protein
MCRGGGRLRRGVVRDAALAQIHGPVVVAMPGVRVVQMSTDEEVEVIAVRDPRVAAVLAVHVRLVVLAAGVGRGAVGGVQAVHRERVLVHVVVVEMMHVTVVEVIGMVLVANGDMATL